MSCNSKFQSPRFKIVDLFSHSNALKTIKKQCKIVHCFASLVFDGSLGLQLISFRHPTTRNYCTHEKSMPCKDTLESRIIVYTRSMYFEKFPRFTVLFGTYTEPLSRRKISTFHLFWGNFLLKFLCTIILFIMDLYIHNLYVQNRR